LVQKPIKLVVYIGKIKRNASPIKLSPIRILLMINFLCVLQAVAVSFWYRDKWIQYNEAKCSQKETNITANLLRIGKRSQGNPLRIRNNHSEIFPANIPKNVAATLFDAQHSPSSWSVEIIGSQFVLQCLKNALRQWFYEYVHYLINTSDVYGLNDFFSDILSHKMTIHLNMLNHVVQILKLL
jgi:hypothetical protein